MIKIVKSSEMEPEIISRRTSGTSRLTATVSAIISNVKDRGDDALREYTSAFDGCMIENIELSRSSINRAIKTVDPEFIKVMKRAAASIEDYHRNQICTGYDLLPKNGVILGQKVTPLARVGCYVPGGTAPYPSSVLMNCIPAKIAGVKELFIATPPTSASGKVKNTGKTNICNGVDARILAAAQIAGVDRIFTVGGAQAIAALAYGTQTIPNVDKVTGPGNAYVTEAKRQIFGTVGIDMLAGPSDVLIIADKNTDPEIVAADMLSQCEHGSDSGAVLVTDSMGLARKVRAQIKQQLSSLPRKGMTAEAIDNNSMIIVASALEEVFSIANSYAPEHLEILLDDPFNYLNKINNAGSVFLGMHTPVTLGDYIAGPNHVLPTNGSARYSSPLTVDDFVKKTSYAFFTEEALCERGNDAIRFAKEERFDAHALAVEKRLKKIKG